MENNTAHQNLEQMWTEVVALKTVLTVKDLCKYTGWSTSTIYKLTSKRILPFSCPNGGKIFFNKEKIDEFLLKNELPTQTDMQKQAISFLNFNSSKGGRK